jgi:hypothetical protein
MPKIRLTQKTVDRQRAPTASRAPIILWDTDLRGFGLLVSGKTATKTYIAQRDLPGGQTRRVSIASVHECPLAQARSRAAKMLLDMRTGIDPGASCSTTRWVIMTSRLATSRCSQPH